MQLEGLPGQTKRTREDTMLKRCVTRVHEIEGRTLTDFGLVLALIAVVCAGVLTLFGVQIDAAFASITGNF